MSVRVFLTRRLPLPAKSGRVSTETFHGSGKGRFNLHIRRKMIRLVQADFSAKKANFPESLHFENEQGVR
jgi:hypothetical protein